MTFVILKNHLYDMRNGGSARGWCWYAESESCSIDGRHPPVM